MARVSPKEQTPGVFSGRGSFDFEDCVSRKGTLLILVGAASPAGFKA
jgi:hypothetical protein